MMRPGLLRQLVLLILVVLLPACGGSADEPAETTLAATTTATPTSVASTTTTTEPSQVLAEGSGRDNDTTAEAYVPPPYAVTATMVSGEETLDIWVFAPEVDGPLPFVFALPGFPGDAKQDLERFATELAGHGVVVFASDWLPLTDADDPVECGYRYSLGIAEDYGG